MSIKNYKEQAVDDLPYLKEKALEYLTKYAELAFVFGDDNQKMHYIKLHFAYMDFYHGTREMLIREGYINEE